MSGQQSAIIKRMNDKLSTAHAEGDRDDPRKTSRSYFEPLQYKASAGQDIYRFSLQRGVTYKNELGLVLEGGGSHQNTITLEDKQGLGKDFAADWLDLNPSKNTDISMVMKVNEDKAAE